MAIQVGTNSYVTLDEAEQYFSERLYTDEWDNADAATKEKALLMACKRIERLQFRGMKADPENQTLQFPRALPATGTVLWNSERRFNDLQYPFGYNFGYIVQEKVPEEVKQAQCEEALALLKYGNSSRIKLQEQNVESVDIGSVSEQYTGLDRLLSKEAIELLRPYLVGAVEIL